jgi:hypothetical protein
MNNINYTLAPLALFLVSCAASQPAANLAPSASGGRVANQTRATGGNNYGHAAGGSGLDASRSGLVDSHAGNENRRIKGDHDLHTGRGGDVDHGTNAGRGGDVGQGANVGRGGAVEQGASLSRGGAVGQGTNVARGGGVGSSGNVAQGGAQQKTVAVLGSWSGNDGQQKISVKFGANGSLLITNAAGANPGQWSGGSGGRFRIQVGAYNGDFVMVDSRTGSLTLGDSSVELKR